VIRRAGAVLAAAALAVLWAAPPAAADPVFAGSDAQALVAVLAKASDAQGVCYGWNVTVTDFGGSGQPGTDVGSNRGVGVQASTCPKWVEFYATVEFTAETSDSDDSAILRLMSDGLADPPEVGDLADLGITQKSLLDDDLDDVTYRGTTALPLLVTQRGGAPPVELDPATAAPPGGGPVARPGSDFLRNQWQLLALGGLLLVAAVAVVLVPRLAEPTRRRLEAMAQQATAGSRTQPPGTPPTGAPPATQAADVEPWYRRPPDQPAPPAAGGPQTLPDRDTRPGPGGPLPTAPEPAAPEPTTPEPPSPELAAPEPTAPHADRPPPSEENPS
jgi:hypothetical protein